MTDLEKVIKGLHQHCKVSIFDRCGECPYYEMGFEPWVEGRFKCRDELRSDVAVLLKEQEKTGTWKQIDDDTYIWSCSECDEPFILMGGTPIENKYYYCPQCGAKMKT